MTKSKKVLGWMLVIVMILASFLTACSKPAATPEAPAAPEKPAWPEKDITIVVPWNPGGGTDLTTRVLADEMSKSLGSTITVINTPGASGSIAMKNVWNASHDGYTIVANGMMPFTSYSVMGLMDETYRDWHVWIATFSPNVLAVNTDSKYKTAKDLVDALKANPGEVKVGTAGPGTGGHIGIEIVRANLGFEYNHIGYGGGNPAIVATLSGEVDVTPQLSMEMVDMLRSNKLRGLAALTDGPLKIDGASDIPSIADEIPEAKNAVPMGESFGIAVPKDTPQEVVDRIEEAFNAAVKSDAVNKFAKEKGVVVLGYSGDKAQSFLDKLASVVCWTLFEGGNAKIAPDQFGIAKP